MGDPKIPGHFGDRASTLNQGDGLLLKLAVIPTRALAAVGLHRVVSFLFRKTPDRKIEETSFPLTSLFSARMYRTTTRASTTSFSTNSWSGTSTRSRCSGCSGVICAARSMTAEFIGTSHVAF